MKTHLHFAPSPIAVNVSRQTPFNNHLSLWTVSCWCEISLRLLSFLLVFFGILAKNKTKLCCAFSPKGVNVSQPTPATTSGVGGPCPVGHYCEAQTSVPSQCPVGTYRDVEYGTQVSDCFDCTLGNYCDTLGLANVSGPCSPGFYCLVASDSPTPTGKYLARRFATCWIDEVMV